MNAPHPLAPYSHAYAGRAALCALLALLLWLAWRSGFAADLAGALAAYAVAVSLLAGLPRSLRDAGLILAVLLLLALGMTAGGWLTDLLRTVGKLPPRPYGLPTALPMAIIWPLLLPGIVRRQLAWREAQALARQAERHAAERTLLEARLAALQGQIEPHFLFNTLANVQYLLRHDADRAERMLERLNAYLRAALPELRQAESTLGQELERLEAYLDIMQIRMGARLAYQLDCPNELRDAALPTLTLATLVENALKHGLEPKPGGGCIVVSATRVGQQLQLSVEDDGVGFSEAGASQGSGVGLRNLRERLAALFGTEAELILEARPAGGVRASLHLPLQGRGETACA
ncbi:sensor histidine kinase [Chitinimonas sp.]|uniref:sensor histidine kinase n=1 Tax=Chitinimonas sp. TaxID=1934313 RepID=UPI002F93B909